MNSKPVYIASPYAGDVEANTAFAIKCCRYAIQQREIPIAPHLIYPQILNDNDPAERAIGLELGHRVLAICKELWVCGSHVSNGMASEIALASEMNIPIRAVSVSQITEEPSVDQAHVPFFPSSPGQSVPVKTGVSHCRPGDLVPMADVLSTLCSNGCNFPALEPIRERYAAQFGNDLCWSFPFWINDYLGCVLLPVQEGILQLCYTAIDSDTYEQFDTEAIRLLTADTVQHLMDVLLTQTADLTRVLANICQDMQATDQAQGAITAKEAN